MAISLEEQNSRYAAIRQLMIKDKLDSLLVAGRADFMGRGNMRYITGHGVRVSDEYCIFPLEGLPVYLGNSFFRRIKMGHPSWNLDFRNVLDPVEVVNQELLRFDKGNRIGIASMKEMSARMYQTVQAKFGNRLVDAGWIFKQVRMIKSREEIEKLRVSVSMCDKAFPVLRDMVRPGLSEYDVYSEAQRIQSDMGCDYHCTYLEAGAKAQPFEPSGKRLEPNGMVSIELAPTFDGYYGQLALALPVGECPPHIRKMAAVWKKALEAGVRILRPGTKTRDVYLAAEKVMTQAGYESFGGFGHALGLDLVDFWSFKDAESTEFKPGMVCAFHPPLIGPGGDGMLMGYTYLITDKGSEKLNQVDVGQVFE